MPEHIKLPERLPAGQTELSPQEVLEWIEYDVDVMERDYKMGYSDATACRGFLEQLTEHFLEMDSLDLSGMDEMQDIRRALLKKMHLSTCWSVPTMDLSPEPKVEKASASTSASSGQAAAAEPGASAVPAAAAVEEPKGEKRKLPQDPEQFFEKVLLPKLQAGQPLDIAGSLADWGCRST